MLPINPVRPRRAAFLLLLSIPAFGLLACGHTEAAPPPVSLDTVMQTVRAYGRGHQSLLTEVNSAKPDQTDISYSAHIRSMLFQEDFAQLEKIAIQNRVEKGRLIGGMWKAVGFYNGTSAPSNEGAPPDADWQNLLTKLQKWQAAFPDSAAVHLSLAYFYVNYAWTARGSGLANTVEDDQWKLFGERNARAKSILLQAATLKEKDPFWYDLIQLVARSEGWDKAAARELFNQAVTFEPGFYHYYIEQSRFLLPQWYGEPGELQAFAEETLRRVPEPDGSMLYFWIFSSEVCYCQQGMGALAQANYPKLRQGYVNISNYYGLSNLNANRFAFMATTFRDQTAAREAFANITKMDEDIWTSQSVFDISRAWATSSNGSTLSGSINSTP